VDNLEGAIRSFFQLPEFIVEENIPFLAAALEQKQLRVQPALGNLASDGAEGRDPGPASEPDDAVGIAQRVMVKVTRRTRAVHHGASSELNISSAAPSVRSPSEAPSTTSTSRERMIAGTAPHKKAAKSSRLGSFS